VYIYLISIKLNNRLQGDRKMFEEFISNNDNLDDVMYKYVEIRNGAMVNFIPLYPSLHKNNIV